MALQNVAASWLTTCQETNFALGNFNIDFSLLKVEAPEEFRVLGRQLTSKRKDAAENGSQHVTARKLGVLFQHRLPRTPHLIKAYGLRASEISSSSEVNPKPSQQYGVFAEHAGLDGTSLWAAATSGPEAIPIHLLACLLARMWSRSEALAIWTELVAARKKELQEIDETDPFYHTSLHLSKISLTRDQLADWDDSTRGWLQGADEAMGRKHVQLQQVINGVSAVVNYNQSPYQSIMQTWTRTMEVVNDLIQGQPHSILNGSILLGLSSWHIYPDMIVLQDTQSSPISIPQNDALVDQGGLLTVGLELKHDSDNGNGVRWSLSLGHLRYYGRPVVTEQKLDTANNRVAICQLTLVAIGCLTETWSLSNIETATFLVRLWEYLGAQCKEFTHGTVHWLGHLAEAGDCLFSQDPLESKQCEQLLRLGRRRCREFLSLSSPVPPAFGLTDLSSILSFVRKNSDNIETCIEIIRHHVQGISRDWNRGFIIRYRLDSGFGRRRQRSYIFATALPTGWSNSKPGESKDGNIQGRHQRWALEERSQSLGPRPSKIYQASHLYRERSPRKRRRREISGEEVLDYSHLEIRMLTKNGSTKKEPWKLEWTSPPKILLPYATMDAQGIPYVHLIQIAGGWEDVILLATEKGTHLNRTSSDTTRLAHCRHELLLDEMKKGSLEEKHMIHSLNMLIFSPQRRDLLVSLRALATVKEIYKLLPAATIDLGVTSKPLHKMPWVRRYVEEKDELVFTLLPINRSEAFSCIAFFESGCFTLQPDGLENVMAMAARGSIYIAAPLLCDPSEEPKSYEIRRIRGSIGKTGIALLIPPQNPEVNDELNGPQWNLVNHNPFDGRLENSFRTTTLHLHFTDYILPIDVGNHGSKSFEIYFLESAVSIHDKGKWIGDVGIIRQLEHQDNLFRMPSSRGTQSGDQANEWSWDLSFPRGKITSVDDWNELLDGPDFVGIVRSHGNWLGRLAAAALSLQLGYQTFVLPQNFCWNSFFLTWINSRQGEALQRNTGEFRDMDVDEMLQLMSGVILIC